MPRFSNTKDTLIEFRKRRPQAGTRYRESGLVQRHEAVTQNLIINCYFRHIAEICDVQNEG